MNTLQAQRESTRMLIEQEGEDVVLIRPAPYVSDNEGGRVRSDSLDTPLEPVRRFFGSVMREGELIVNDNGQQYVTEHVLIGLPEDDIRNDDYFDFHGQRYYVRYVNPDQRFQTKAFVSRHASP